MPEMTKADPAPDKPDLYLTGSYFVVASPESISETTFCIPAVRAIRWSHPRETLVVLANPSTAPLWRKVSGIDLTLEYSHGDSARNIVRLLKKSQITYDSSIAWEDGPAAQAFAKLGIKQRLGYPSDKLAKLLTAPVEVIRDPGPIEHRVEHYLLFVKKLGVDPFHPANFATPARRPAPAKPILAIAPGSDFGPAAEWPLERFIELARQAPPEFKLAILPSPDRPGPATQLAKALKLKVTDLEGEALLDFLSTCQGLLGNDGSLPHLAAFMGTPSLVLFGPNEPLWRRPLGKIHQAIRRHVPCSGCLLNKCPLDHRCMNEITVESMAKDLRAFLQPKEA